MSCRRNIVNCIAAGCCSISRFFHRFSKKKNILLIRDDGLGDLLFWLPYQQEIREHYPRSKYHLTLFIKSEFTSLAGKSDSVDKILYFPPYRNNLQWGLFRIFFWLTHSYDMICDLTSFPPETRPRYNIVPHYKKYLFSTIITPASLPNANNIKGDFIHVINGEGKSVKERCQAILSTLGISAKPQKFDYAQFCQSFAETPETKSFFAVCSGSSDPRRNWEKNKFVELIDRIQNTTGLTAVLVGSPVEWDSCETIRKQCRNPEKIKNFAGKTSILQLFSVIKNSLFLIANETGTCHIGAALGVQTFIICGLGDYGVFVPYPEGLEGKSVHSIFSKKRTCAPCIWQNELCRKQKTYPCISDISVDEVFNMIRSGLPS